MKQYHLEKLLIVFTCVSTSAAACAQADSTKENKPRTNEAGEFFYFNNAGVGYFTANADCPLFPATLHTPSALGASSGYWRSASGFLYPWLPCIFDGHERCVYTMQQGFLKKCDPPVDTVLGDLRNFIDAAKDKNQLSKAAWQRAQKRIDIIADIYGKHPNESEKPSKLNHETSVALNVLVTELLREISP